MKRINRIVPIILTVGQHAEQTTFGSQMKQKKIRTHRVKTKPISNNKMPKTYSRLPLSLSDAENGKFNIEKYKYRLQSGSR